MKLEFNSNSILTTVIGGVACYLITTEITAVHDNELKLNTMIEKVARIEAEQARVRREYHPETDHHAPTPAPSH